MVQQFSSAFVTGYATESLLETIQSVHNRQIAMRRPLPLPSSVLVDSQGRIAAIYKGPVSVKTFLQDVEELEASHVWRSASSVPGRSLEHPRTRAIQDRLETIVRFRLGLELEQNQQWMEAIEHYKALIAHAPDYVEAYNNLGNALAIPLRRSLG